MNNSLGKVFMLDDDVLILDMYKNLFETKGYEVFATDNAYKFLQYAKEIRPDVLILDLNMPVMNGWEVINRLQQEEKLKDIPVLMLTVSSEEEMAFARGVSHLLRKPLQSEELLDIVESYALGNKNHDVLLLEEYEPIFSSLAPIVRLKKHTLFHVHDVRTANLYLNKNTPRVFCAKLSDEKFDAAKKKLKNQNVYKVENISHIENLLK